MFEQWKKRNELRIQAAIAHERQALAQRREHDIIAQAMEKRIAMEMAIQEPGQSEEEEPA